MTLLQQKNKVSKNQTKIISGTIIGNIFLDTFVLTYTPLTSTLKNVLKLFCQT